MDDGILLNFAPPPQASNKAGAKAKFRQQQQQNKKRPAPAPAPTPSSASPTVTKKPRLATSTPVQPQQEASQPNAQPERAAAAVSPSTSKARPVTQSNKPQQQSSGPKTFISSLFPRTITESATPISNNEANSGSKADITPTNAPSMTGPVTFKSLQLHPFLVNHLTTRMDIQRPTAIQRRALPALLQAANTQQSLYTSGINVKQHDFMIHSQTGSGKTLTYLLPIIHHLLPLSQESFINRTIGTMGIILAPTRELARQIYDVLERVLSLSLRPEESEANQETSSKHYSRWLVPCLLTGGATRTHEKSRLRKGCPLIVSTPGRLLDHLQNTSTLDVGKLQWLVLDEADRLMDLGFEETLQEIVTLLDVKRKVAISKTRMSIAENQDGDPADSGDSDSDDEDWDKKLQREEAKMGIKTTKPKLAPVRKPTTSSQAQLVPETELADSLGICWWKVPRRTVLCSATLDESVQKLAGATLQDPLVLKPTFEDEQAVQEAAELDAKTKSAASSAVPESSTSGQKEQGQSSSKSGPPAKFLAPAQLAQHFVVVPPKLRLVTLLALLRGAILSSASSGRGENRVIVFLSCTDSVDFHWRALGGIKMDGQGGGDDGEDEEEEAEEDGASDDESEEKNASKEKANARGQAKSIADQVTRRSELLPNVPIFRLHGSMTQAERVASLRAFTGKASPKDKSQKNAKAQPAASSAAVLLCTSVAARGLDLPSVRTVIQLDAPTEGGVEEYVHRIGRTARVGKSGESWLILLESERSWVQVLEAGISVEVRRGRDGATENKSKPVEVAEERVEAVLAKGFGGQAREFEYEARATDVQLAFERWVLSGEEAATLARKAFLSHIRAYATHPSSEKHIFHTKFLHLGHLAKAFALREAPTAIKKLAHTPSKKIPAAAAVAAGAGRNKGTKPSGSAANGKKAASSTSARPVKPLPGGKAGKASNSHLDVPSVGDAEARMYAKVRAMGKTSKKGGTLGAYGADEFQIG